MLFGVDEGWRIRHVGWLAVFGARTNRVTGTLNRKATAASLRHEAVPGRLLLALFLLLALALAFVIPARAAEVYIVDTLKRDNSVAFASALNNACDICRPVKYMDMKGSYKLGRQIIAQLQGLQQEKQLDLVVTLGKPALRLLSKELRDVPIFYGLVDDPEAQDADNLLVKDFSAVPPISLQINSLLAMAPGIRKIGFLAAKSSLDPFREEALAVAREKDVLLRFYYIQHAHDVPAGLRKAIQEMDGLVFVRDRLTVNANTIDYILQMTLENQIPTLGYTDMLVDKGMMAALAPDHDKLGTLIGEAVKTYLATGTMPPLTSGPDLFLLHVNDQVLRQTPNAQAAAPSGVRMVLK